MVAAVRPMGMDISSTTLVALSCGVRSTSTATEGDTSGLPAGSGL
jgi:hypothetical protein